MSITCPPHDYAAIGNLTVCNKCNAIFDPAHPPLAVHPREAQASAPTQCPCGLSREEATSCINKRGICEALDANLNPCGQRLAVHPREAHASALQGKRFYFLISSIASTDTLHSFILVTSGLCLLRMNECLLTILLCSFYLLPATHYFSSSIH